MASAAAMKKGRNAARVGGKRGAAHVAAPTGVSGLS